MVVLFALSLIALVLIVGLVVDSGFAFAQRRGTQNAADFAAAAGTQNRRSGAYWRCRKWH